ncbi:transposase [Streptomyces sp. NPDC000994]
MGPILRAEFVVTSGDLASYTDAGHLASGWRPFHAIPGAAPATCTRPKRYSRRLRRVFYLSAQTSIIRERPTRAYYLKKRGEAVSILQLGVGLTDAAACWNR